MENAALIISTIDTAVVYMSIACGAVMGATMMWFTMDLKRQFEEDGKCQG